jgi:hypothetical protein
MLSTQLRGHVGQVKTPNTYPMMGRIELYILEVKEVSFLNLWEILGRVHVLLTEGRDLYTRKAGQREHHLDSG